MKTRQCMAVAALILTAMTGCTSQKEVKSTSGLDLTNMDTTVSAGQDFSSMLVADGTKSIR